MIIELYNFFTFLENSGKTNVNPTLISWRKFNGIMKEKFIFNRYEAMTYPSPLWPPNLFSLSKYTLPRLAQIQFVIIELYNSSHIFENPGTENANPTLIP